MLTNKQIATLKRDITATGKKISDLLSPNNFKNITKAGKEDLIKQARVFMNRVTENSYLLIEGVPLQDIFADQYEAVRKKLVNQGFKLGKLTAKTSPEVKNIKAQYFNALHDNQTAQEYTFGQKVTIVDKTMKAQVGKSADLFKPRSTILQFNNQKIDTITKSNALKTTIKHTERDMVKLLDKSINEGWNYDKTFKAAKKNVQTVFPDNYVYSTRKTPSGKTITWKQDIDKYTGDWIQSSQVQAHSKGTVAAMLKAGADIVVVRREGGSTCPICNEIIGRGKDGKYFSLTGSTPGYPVLASTSPFHVHCDCSIDVAPSSVQEPISDDYNNKELKEVANDVTSKEKQQKQQKEVVKTLKEDAIFTDKFDPLSGSEKQIKWGNDIRKEKLTDSLVGKREDPNIDLHKKRWTSTMNVEEKASWWIDNRNESFFGVTGIKRKIERKYPDETAVIKAIYDKKLKSN